MLGGNHNSNTTTGIEIDFDPAPSWLERVDEVIQ
jgi:hypothetical protein